MISLETQKNFGSDYFEAPATFKKRVVEKRPKQSEVEDILDFLEGNTEQTKLTTKAERHQELL